MPEVSTDHLRMWYKGTEPDPAKKKRAYLAIPSIILSILPPSPVVNFEAADLTIQHTAL
jgi:hypothetical protein